MSTKVEIPPDDPPVEVGDIVRMEPIFEDGELKGFAILDAATGELITIVPREQVTFTR
jgi:hypothetical protein